MSIPASLREGLRLPVIVAPMFLVSGPELVTACCAQGAIGTFPALNQRSTAGLDEWLTDIKQRNVAYQKRSGSAAAAFGVNLIVHKSNPRLDADLAVCTQHRVPLIITSLGAATTVVEQVHAYGGVVFHDVTTLKHAEKAAAAGVDGLILVCAGAGGHAGLLNPFAFSAQVRRFFNGTIVLAGCINTANEIAAAKLVGADLAYMGTRFIATQESLASPAYKQMLLRAKASDIVYTPAVSGVHGNFLRDSLIDAGFSADAFAASALGNKEAHLGAELAQASSQRPEDVTAWRDVWSAGQGAGSIDDVPTVKELLERLSMDYARIAADHPLR